MPWPEYTGPDKANKGLEGGACNRYQCQDEPANWFNHGSNAWYCEGCKVAIGEDWVNKRDWEMRWQPTLGHPMFETREQISARVDVSLDDKVIDDISPPRFLIHEVNQNPVA